jgi:protoporphyrinogen oxidase
MSNKKKAIIIGAGPAGLTAAYEFLKKNEIEPIIIEKSKLLGGISRTVDYKGNKIDIGGHRFFSKSDEVMEWWKNILKIESENEKIQLTYHNATHSISTVTENKTQNEDNIFMIRKRLSRIYYKKTFFNYPIALSIDTILKLGLLNTFLIGLSYFKSLLFPIKNENNLEDFFINRFGKRLYLTFFKDYTEKVWGVPCNEISAEWGAQRIKGLSILKSVSHFIKSKFVATKSIDQKNVETSLIEYFLYPKYGPGQLWEEVARQVEVKGAKIMMKHVVENIQIQNGIVKSVDVRNLNNNEISTIEADFFISTMPVVELINNLKNIVVPNYIQEIANGLLYRDFITVGILCEKLKIGKVEDNWIYIQEPYVKVGRIQIFNNWSPFMIADERKTWIGLEYFCYENDALWNLTTEEMKALAVDELVKLGMLDKKDYLDSVVIKMPKTYPAYFGTYDRFSEIREFIDNIENLFLVGRNGMHKYNNQDHSMLTAITAVNNIENNITDKSNIWSVNTEQEYHEKK